MDVSTLHLLSTEGWGCQIGRRGWLYAMQMGYVPQLQYYRLKFKEEESKALLKVVTDSHITSLKLETVLVGTATKHSHLTDC